MLPALGSPLRWKCRSSASDMCSGPDIGLRGLRWQPTPTFQTFPSGLTLPLACQEATSSPGTELASWRRVLRTAASRGNKVGPEPTHWLTIQSSLPTAVCVTCSYARRLDAYKEWDPTSPPEWAEPLEGGKSQESLWGLHRSPSVQPMTPGCNTNASSRDCGPQEKAKGTAQKEWFL